TLRPAALLDLTAPLPSAGPYVQPAYFDPNYQQRQKPVRAAQACDLCRQRKAKCDEGRPECQHCKDNGLKCTYRELPAQKTEKQMLTITDKLETMTGNIEMLIQHQKTQSEQFHRQSEQFQRQSEQISIMLHALQKNPGSADVGAAATPDEQVEFARRLKKPTQVDSTVEKYPFRRGESSEAQSKPRARNQATSPLLKEGNQEGNLETEPFELTLPAKHTTAVQNLVNWPSIKALIPAGITTSYIIDEESGRGLLRLSGSGEGEDKHNGHEGVPSPAGSTSSEGRRMDEETSSSPHGVWGTGQFHAPLTCNHSHTARDHPGGVSPRGGLMLDSEAIDRYFRSYMANIHILHPFLEPMILRNMIHIFK
ncbi:hypothetical protein LTR72_012172, partial [Exophiala xenobiotica]